MNATRTGLKLLWEFFLLTTALAFMVAGFLIMFGVYTPEIKLVAALAFWGWANTIVTGTRERA